MEGIVHNTVSLKNFNGINGVVVHIQYFGSHNILHTISSK